MEQRGTANSEGDETAGMLSIGTDTSLVDQ